MVRVSVCGQSPVVTCVISELGSSLAQRRESTDDSSMASHTCREKVCLCHCIRCIYMCPCIHVCLPKIRFNILQELPRVKWEDWCNFQTEMSIDVSFFWRLSKCWTIPLCIHNVYLLIGPSSCVCTVGFMLWELADSGTGPRWVLHLQHRGTRGAELTETTFKVLIQVAIKNWVQTTAGGRNKVIV